jgi:cobalamin biosynthesis protein CbiD
MKEIEELREEKTSGEKNRFEHIVIVTVMALLIGLVAGLFSHDHLARFNPEHLVWKSWSPR